MTQTTQTTQSDTPTPYRIIATLGDLVIAVRPQPAVEPGHQEILISLDSPHGGDQAPQFASLLLGRSTGYLGRSVEIRGARWLVVPHTQIVDERLRALVDLAHAVRMAAPGVVQLQLSLEASL